MAARCCCGHPLEEHPFVVGDIFSCNKCKCKNYKESEILQRNGKTVVSIEEKLREVLRNKYKEFCPNCDRHLGIADADWDTKDYSPYCRIVCQNCFLIVVDIKPKYYRSLDNINNFIEVLNQFSEADKAE